MDIINASPQVINLGTDDQSVSAISPSPAERPQHFPKIYMYAKKGGTNPTPFSGIEAMSHYGTDTFDINKKYYNHQTRFALGIAGKANKIMYTRLVPEDAGPKSNITLYADIASADVPNYLRNSDGTYVIENGVYKTDPDTPIIDGYKVKIISDYSNTNDVELGLAMSKPGTMFNKTGTLSTMYPILQLKAKYQGEFYNNIGLAITNPNTQNTNPSVLSATKALTYALSLVYREDKNATYNTKASLYGEPSVTFSLKEKAVNPLTKAVFDLKTVFKNNWYNERNRLLPTVYEEYENIFVYNNNIQSVLGMLMEKEKAYISSDYVEWEDGMESSTLDWFDFTTDDSEALDEELYLMNLFNGKSSKGVKYFTFVMDSGDANLTGNLKQVEITSTTPVFLNGGSDGTLSDEMFETLFMKDMAKYIDPDSDVMDTAINLETVLYDSGFSVDAKMTMVNFIALRKNTYVCMSTHIASLGEKYMPLSEQRAIAAALKTTFKMAPESTYYGTSVMRALFVGGTGNLADNSTSDEVPLSYAMALKSAAFMGAGNGAWNGVYAFDRAPGNVITEQVNIKPEFIPAGIKPTLWNDGLVWAQPFDRVQYQFPAIQTIYENDTSVGNSLTTIVAICAMSTIADDAWRNFTGSTSLSDAELAEAVENFVNEAIKDKFNGQLVVIPRVQFTVRDKQRGYSWRLVNEIYAHNMKSVMVYTTRIYRYSAL